MLRRLSTILLIIVSSIGTTACKDYNSESEKQVLQAREVILRDNLLQLRKMIDQYAADNSALPQSLDDLVKAGYLREVPDDPMTGKKDWKITLEAGPNAFQIRKGIVDVHSASTAKSSEGTLYSEW